MRAEDLEKSPQYKELIDAGKRASDVANMYIHFMDQWELRTKWLAFRLQDGSSDGVIYDSRKDAVKHQFDERRCAYFSFRNCLGGTNARDMAIFLNFCREAYDAGFRLIDPDYINGGPEILPTANVGDYQKTLMRWRENGGTR